MANVQVKFLNKEVVPVLGQSREIEPGKPITLPKDLVDNLKSAGVKLVIVNKKEEEEAAKRQAELDKQNRKELGIAMIDELQEEKNKVLNQAEVIDSKIKEVSEKTGVDPSAIQENKKK